MPLDPAHTQRLLDTHRRRLQLLEEDAARRGYNTPPEICMEIEDLQSKIARMERGEPDPAVVSMGLPPGLLHGNPATASTEQMSALAKATGIRTQPSLPDPAAAVPAGSRPTIDVASPALLLDPPPLSPFVSQRTQTVGTILPGVMGRTWTALLGGVSTGKTQLAIILAGRVGGRVVWIDFHGRGDDPAAAEYTERACAVLAGSPPPPQREAWYGAICTAVGADGLVVLNHLPDLSRSPQLQLRVLAFARALRVSGLHILSTSQDSLPLALRSLLGDEQCAELEAPALTDNEVADVLRAYGAPEPSVDQLVRLVHHVVRQHPFLLVAASHYLQRHAWRIGDSELADLLTGVYAAPFDHELFRKLQATVTDTCTRELLYRLAIVRGTVLRSQIEAVASVSPPIEQPLERVRDLTNSWMQRVKDGEWNLSALVSRLAASHLIKDVSRRCHFALAELIVRQPMDQRLALDAVLHYHEAGELGRAGTILMLMLDEARRSGAAIGDDPLMLLWTGVPLPSAMDLNLRLVVRGLQVTLFQKFGKPLDFLIHDLDALVAQVQPTHHLGLAGAVSQVIVTLAPTDPKRANGYLRKLLEVIPTTSARRKPKRRREKGPILPRSFPVGDLVLLLVQGITTGSDLREWLETVGLVSPEERQRAFRGFHGQITCLVVANSLVEREVAKPIGERNWPNVLKDLAELSQRGRALRLELLWAAAIRATITVQAEHCHELDEAVTTAQAALAAASSDPVVRYFIAGTMGYKCVGASRYDDARYWLRLALDQRATAAYPHERMLVLLAASRAFGREDAAAGVRYAEQAVTEAVGSDLVPLVERVRALSELAVAQFLEDGAAAAFSAWDQAAEALFAAKEPSNEWKDLAVIFGHTLGYMVKLAETGVPPETISTGEPYAPPERGLFLTANSARIPLYDERREGALCLMLAWYALSVGNEDRGTTWSTRAAEMARRDRVAPLLVATGRDDVIPLLQRGAYREAFELARISAAGMVVVTREIEAGRDPARPDLDILTTLSGLPIEDRKSAESFGLIMGVIPAILHIATRAIGEHAREQALADANTVMQLCREIAPNTNDPSYWINAADAIDLAYIQGHPYERVMDWYRSLPQPTSYSLTMLANLCATAQALPEQALRNNLSIMPTLSGCYRPRSQTYNRLLLPFVEVYWTHAFEQMRVYFRAPEFVQQLLVEAKTLPEDQRLRGILRAVHAGFRAPLAHEIRQWLDGPREPSSFSSIANEP